MPDMIGGVSALFFFSSRRRHTRFDCDWSSDVCSSDLESKHADIGISLPGTSEEPRAPVYVDGKLKVTLKGDSIVTDFLKMLEEYVETRSEEHTSELQSQSNLVCRLLLEKKKHKSASHA